MYGSVLRKLGVVTLIVGFCWLVIKFLFPFALPFIFAWGVAACLQPAVKIMSRRFGINPRPVAAVFVAVAVMGLGTLIFLLVSRFISELGGFLSALGENTENGIGGFFDKLSGFLERVPFLSAIGGDISETVRISVQRLLSELTAAIPAMIGRVLGALPGFFIFTVIIIMASYYFAADFDGIREKAYNALPQKLRMRWDAFKKRLMGAGIQYLKACLALAFITFSELLVGFLVLGVPYAFTLAVIIALVDMLPILGAGTVLLPWAVWEWITGNGYYAIGLLIIFAVVTVVHRFAEPRIISSGIGLSPITTLVSMYIGFKAFGLGGLFLAPLFAVLILSALPENISSALGMPMNAEENEEEGYEKRKKHEF